MLSFNGTNIPPGNASTPARTSRAIWSYFLEKIAHQGGPFAGHAKTQQFEELVDKAVSLFPDGIPSRNRKWRLPDGVDPSEFGKFLKKVFTRTIPTPISKLRWLKFG